MAAHELVIRNARIHDGTGSPEALGDMAVDGGRISALGTVDGTGETEIDAGGQVLMPGIIDIHTHYDAQLTWVNGVQVFDGLDCCPVTGPGEMLRRHHPARREAAE